MRSFSFLLFVACGSSSSNPSGTVPMTCADVATEICKRAVACRNDGSAPVRIGVSNIVYQSQAYCEMTLRDQCGPSTPASYVPRIADPVACGKDAVNAVCEQTAYKLPVSCGGK